MFSLGSSLAFFARISSQSCAGERRAFMLTRLQILLVLVVCVLCKGVLGADGATAANPCINVIHREGWIDYNKTKYGWAATIEIVQGLKTATDGTVAVRMTNTAGRAKVKLLTGKGGGNLHSFTYPTTREVTENYVWAVSIVVSPEEIPVYLDDGYYSFVKFVGPKIARVRFPAYPHAVVWSVYEGGDATERGKLIDTVKMGANETKVKEYKVTSGKTLYFWMTNPEDGSGEYMGMLNPESMTKDDGVTDKNTVSAGAGSGDASNQTVGDEAYKKVTTTAGATDAARDQTIVAAANSIGAAIDRSKDAIVDAINKNGGSGGSSGSVNVSVEMGTTNGKIDQVKDKLTEQAADVKTIAGLFSAGKDFSVDGQLGTAKAKADAAAATYGAAKPSGDGAASGISGGNSYGTFGKIKVGDQDINFGLDLSDGPFATADQVMRGGRSVILYAILIWFLYSAGQLLSQYIIGLGGIDSGTSGAVGPENIVPGVAQLKGWGAAGIIVAGLITATTAMIAIVDGWTSSKGVGVADILRGFDLSAVGNVVGWLDNYMPIGAMFQIMAMRAALPYLLAPLYIGACALVKFTKA